MFALCKQEDGQGLNIGQVAMAVMELDTHMIETATFCGIVFTEGGIATSHHEP